MDDVIGILLERQCAICGKTIYPTREWTYKIKAVGKHKTRWYCSYTCWRKDGGGSGKNIDHGCQY